MALVFNGDTKIITITNVNTLNIADLWSRWVDWLLTADNSKYEMAMIQVGGNDIDILAGTSIPVYIYLNNGWKIKPREANHTLVVNNGILLTSDSSTPYITTNDAYNVIIRDQQPIQAITVSTNGGGGSTPAEIWDYPTRVLSADGVTEIKNGLATSEELDRVKNNTNLIPALL